MPEFTVRMPLEADTVDGLIGSPYFHAGFRAFCHPGCANRYRLPPTPSLESGHRVHWPALAAGEGHVQRHRGRGKPGALGLFWKLRRVAVQRPAVPLTVIERRPGQIRLRWPWGPAVTIQVTDDGPEQSLVTVTGRQRGPMSRRLREYLEAEGRDWRDSLDHGIRPLVDDPHPGWVESMAGRIQRPTRAADGSAVGRGFESVLMIRHAVEARSAVPGMPQEHTWAQVAEANGVEITAESMWWDIAVVDSRPPPQESPGPVDDRFGAPRDGAEGLAELGALFAVLTEHTVTPQTVFGALFPVRGGLALDDYGPGLDYSTARYVSEPGASAHPPRTVFPASQICTPWVRAWREMALFQLVDAAAVTSRTVELTEGLDAVWPGGREWLVLTDIDWEYTLIGCDRATAEAVLSAEGFEAVEVD